MIALPTRPEALEVALDRSAIIVVDMQNAFASRGGLLDLAGIDISGAAEVVRTVADLRAAGIAFLNDVPALDPPLPSPCDL